MNCPLVTRRRCGPALPQTLEQSRQRAFAYNRCRNRRSRNAAGVALNVFQSIFGASNVVSLMTTEPGMVQSSAGNVTGATQQGTCGFAWSPTGTVTYTASDPLPGGQDNGTITYGTAASALTNGHNRFGPATQPYYRAAIVRIPTWVNAQRTLANGAGNNNNQAVVHSGTPNGLAGVNSSGGNPDYGMPLGTWVMVECQMSGTNLLTDVGQDYLQVRGLLQAGVNFGGATARTGQSMGRGVGVQQKFYIEVNGRPTIAQLSAFNDEIARRFGASVVRTPLNASTRLICFDTQSNGESEGVTDSVGPGVTDTTPLSAMTRTSATADRNTCPLILRVPKTRSSCAPIGKWGYELQMMLDLKAGGKEPICVIKNSFGSTSMVEAITSPVEPLVTSHYGEFAGELNGVTKCFLVVDRGNTDMTQGVSQATARTRYNNLFADRIALIKAQCPSLVNAGIYIVSVEIAIDPAFIPATLLVNNGRLDALTDQAALGYNTINVTTSDMSPTAPPHWDSAQNNTIGSRIATPIAANW